MKRLQLAHYMITDDWGRRRRSACLLSHEDAQARHRDPVMIETTAVWIDAPETEAELMANSTSSWQRGPNEKKPPNPPQG